MYLDDEVADKPYQVRTYRDHFQDKFVRYFDDYDSAYHYFKSRIGNESHGRYTAAAVIIRTADGCLLAKETWRIKNYV